MKERRHERGSAMLITLILIASLIGGAAVLISLQMSSNRSADLTQTSMASLYCAEAGLAAARPVVASNQINWAATLAAGGTTEPGWLTGGIGNHDLDGDGDDDFAVYIMDNDDEIAPAANNPAVDIDQRVFVVSTCIKYPDTPKAVTELIEVSGGGNCYQSQLGGCGGYGNTQ